MENFNLRIFAKQISNITHRNEASPLLTWHDEHCFIYFGMEESERLCMSGPKNLDFLWSRVGPNCVFILA